MPNLYDAVARGMWTYSHAAFRVETVTIGPLRIEPGTLIASTHRKESDVPVICPPLYFAGGMRRDRTRRMHFAARDDMFLPGFFAGFPANLPRAVRKALYPVGVARWLPVVDVHPIRSATVARLGEVLAALPREPLERVAAPETVAELEARAASSGLGRPVAAGDVLRGEFADILWRPVSPGAGVQAGLDGYWSARAAQAARDFRVLVELLRSRTTLLVFPEGRPSPDGEIGPVRPGSGALLRRGRPVAVQPVGLAYDPLVRGRVRIVIGFPEPVAAPQGRDAETALLEVLRRSVPLTAGQLAAHMLLRGAEADPRALLGELEEAVEAAREDGRPVESELLSAAGRGRRLAEALSVAPAKPEALSFLAREYASARVPAAP